MLTPQILRVFTENFRVYGARKAWRQLKRKGFDIARCTVSRLMKPILLKGVIRDKPHRTTFSDKAAPCQLDRVNRIFTTPAPTPGACVHLDISRWCPSAVVGMVVHCEHCPIKGTGLPCRHRSRRSYQQVGGALLTDTASTCSA